MNLKRLNLATMLTLLALALFILAAATVSAADRQSQAEAPMRVVTQGSFEPVTW